LKSANYKETSPKTPVSTDESSNPKSIILFRMWDIVNGWLYNVRLDSQQSSVTHKKTSRTPRNFK